MSDTSPITCGQRAFLTGSSGFIGSHLVRHLHAAGWEVHVLQRPARERKPCPNASITQVHGYLGATEDIVQAMEVCKPNVVFHLASLFLAQHSPQQVIPLVEANVLLGTQLLEAMRFAGVTALVNTGTSWQHFHSDRFKPVNLYAATKQAFEDILAYYSDAAGIRSVTLKLFDSYGPGDTRKKLLHLLVESLRTGQGLQMSGGEQMLDLAHVDDICKAFLRAAQLLREVGHPAVTSYSVGGGQRRSLRDVVATLESVAGRKLQIDWGARPYREREVMRLWDGPVLPGWEPKIALVDGFAALLRENLE
jgi:nucleoside-diphosphate-sugar epimerase